MGDNTAPEIVDTIKDEEKKDPIEDEKHEMPDEESKPEIEKPKSATLPPQSARTIRSAEPPKSAKLVKSQEPPKSAGLDRPKDLPISAEAPKSVENPTAVSLPKSAGAPRSAVPPNSVEAPKSAITPKSAKPKLMVVSEPDPPPRYQPPPSPKPRPAMQDARPAQAALLYGEPNKTQPRSGWEEPAPERDPNRLNTHLQVEWDDIIGEPNGLKTMDCAWNLSQKCYSGCLNCCYTLTTCFYAPVFGCFFGICMALFSFEKIWITGPLIRLMKIQFAIMRKVTKICMAATWAPLMETLGLVFSGMKIRHQQVEGQENNDDPDKIFSN